MTLPKQIDPCPINQAVVGIRFNSTLPDDAIFGVVYNTLKDSYPAFEYLPILQIPEAVRNSDPNLMFQPHYKITKDFYALQIGPRVMTFGIVDHRYTTWESFYEELQTVFNKIRELNFISAVSRVGLRFINYFEGDIWKDIKIQIKIIDNEVPGEETFVRTVLNKDEYKIILQAGNQLVMRSEGGADKKVSVIDTDAVIQSENINFFENMDSILGRGHLFQKEIFFGLIKDDFLQTLNPEY